jgi:hypothetical protein
MAIAVHRSIMICTSPFARNRFLLALWIMRRGEWARLQTPQTSIALQWLWSARTQAPPVLARAFFVGTAGTFPRQFCLTNQMVPYACFVRSGTEYPFPRSGGCDNPIHLKYCLVQLSK